jgi:hypothetical protein
VLRGLVLPLLEHLVGGLHPRGPREELSRGLPAPSGIGTSFIGAFSEAQEHSEPLWYTLKLKRPGALPNILVFAEFALYLTREMS